MADAGSRWLRRYRLHPPFRFHHHLRLVLQLRGAPRAETSGMTARSRSLRQRLFEPKDLNSQAPLARIATYGILVLWTLVVLLPLYWVLITSFKIRIVVDSGPYYLPFLDYVPSL